MATIKNLPVEHLAKFQQAQIGNSCAISSACTALNLLFGKQINAKYWIEKIDQLPFPQIFEDAYG